MYRRNGISAMGVIFAVVVSVLAVSIVWATYSTTLKVSGSATVAAGKWSMIISNTPVCTGSNTQSGVSSTAQQTGTISVNTDKNTISGLAISLATPGDTVSCKFKIKNAGTFPAKVSSTFRTVSTSNYLTCSTSSFCSYITTTLTYTSDDSPVAIGNSFGVNDEKEVELKMVYSASVTTSQLPSSEINITVADITIPIEQS